MNIYVGNLPYSVTEDELRESFASFGEVSSVSIITDRFSGQSKGFGFVEMPNDNEGAAAIEALEGKEVMGRPIRCNESEQRERPRKF